MNKIDEPETQETFSAAFFTKGRDATDIAIKTETTLMELKIEASHFVRRSILMQGYFNGNIELFIDHRVDDEEITCRVAVMSYGLPERKIKTLSPEQGSDASPEN